MFNPETHPTRAADHIAGLRLEHERHLRHAHHEPAPRPARAVWRATRTAPARLWRAARA